MPTASMLQAAFAQASEGEGYIRCFTLEQYNRAISYDNAASTPLWPVRICTNTETLIDGPNEFSSTSTGSAANTLFDSNTHFRTTVGAQAGARIIRTSGAGSPQSGLVVSVASATAMTTSGITWTGSGQTYTIYRLYAAAALEVVDADDEAEGVPRIRATLIGARYDLVTSMRGITFAPVCTEDIVLISTPSTIEKSSGIVKLRSARAVEGAFEFEFRNDETDTEPFPGYRHSPQLFPGQF